MHNAGLVSGEEMEVRREELRTFRQTGCNDHLVIYSIQIASLTGNIAIWYLYHVDIQDN